MLYIQQVQALNFPKYEFKVIDRNNKPYIFDIIRKKYVALLPEEWVRQHILHYLLFDKHYPRGLIKVEQHLKINKQRRFTDITVFNTDGKPMLLVESKSFKIKINESTFEQIAAYSLQAKANYFVVSNGLLHYVYELNTTTGESKFLNDIPDYRKIKAP